jgi:hypothetical protein
MPRMNGSGEIEERIVPGWLFPRGPVAPQATLPENGTALMPLTTALQMRA